MTEEKVDVGEVVGVAEESLEDLFQEDIMGNAFEGSSVDGDAQLLEVASKHTLQLTGQQIKAILYVDHIFELGNFEEKEKRAWENFKKNYITYTSHNNSQPFIQQVLGHISLRRFINENTLKVSVDKNA